MEKEDKIWLEPDNWLLPITWAAVLFGIIEWAIRRAGAVAVRLCKLWHWTVRRCSVGVPGRDKTILGRRDPAAGKQVRVVLPDPVRVVLPDPVTVVLPDKITTTKSGSG